MRGDQWHGLVMPSSKQNPAQLVTSYGRLPCSLGKRANGPAANLLPVTRASQCLCVCIHVPLELKLGVKFNALSIDFLAHAELC